MYSLVNKQKIIPIAKQKSDLLYTFKGSECELKKDILFWKGIIKPTPLSKEYEVIIQYQINNLPRIQVFVTGDNIKELDNPDFPHKYKIIKEMNTVKICLDRYQAFNKYKYISTTIIPWTMEWLYYYEIWLATGKWQGGGEHPGKGEIKKETY